MADQKFIVRGEYPQSNNLRDGFGSEWQGPELASLEEARKYAKNAVGFNVRIYEVKGDNGAEYPLVERKNNE